jgi:Domain of unknown function (DUF4926)
MIRSGWIILHSEDFPSIDYLFRAVKSNCVNEMDTLATVALLKPVNDSGMPDRNLLRGQVGTIAESLASDVCEVEFSDEEGRTYASLALPESQLIQLAPPPCSRSRMSRYKKVDQFLDKDRKR